MTSTNPRLFFAAALLLLLVSCRDAASDRDFYTNPVYTSHENTSFIFHEGKYYYLKNQWGKFYLQVGTDPTRMDGLEEYVVADPEQEHGLIHLWHPQLTRIRGKWYIYFTGDHGNTDDHQLYVLENPSADPTQGRFEMVGRLITDPEENWAIHGYVFEYGDELYITWSGWESRRVFAETQCIYIARMENPWTISSERVLLSKPEYVWERQWVNPDKHKTAYPVYVNEAPFFFCADVTDKAYIFYSASAQWTSYYCIGRLSAPKGSDLLDPDSWEKSREPVFSQNPAKSIYGPGLPYIVPSPDYKEYYLIYMAREKISVTNYSVSHTVRMQKISFTPTGEPILGTPLPDGVKLRKPSGVE